MLLFRNQLHIFYKEPDFDQPSLIFSKIIVRNSHCSLLINKANQLVLGWTGKVNKKIVDSYRFSPFPLGLTKIKIVKCASLEAKLENH